MFNNHFRTALLIQQPIATHGLSVHSGCYTKIPQTGWLINSRYLFLEAGSLRSVCNVAWSSKDPFLGHRLSLYLHIAEGGQKFLWNIFHKALIPLMRALPYDCTTSQKPHLISSSLGIGISTYELGRDTNIQTIAWLFKLIKIKNSVPQSE